MKKFIINFFSILCLVHCSNIDQNEKGNFQYEIKRIPLTKVNVYQLQLEGVEIGSIEHPAVEDVLGDYIIFKDPDLNQIIVTHKTGEVRSIFGSSGSGPEEFTHISSLGINKENEIVVYDGVLDKFKEFNLDGTFIRTYGSILDDNVWYRSDRLYFDGESMYMAIQEASKSSSKNHFESRTVAEFDRSGNLLNTYGTYDPDLKGNTNTLYKYANILYDPFQRLLYSTHRAHNKIQIINPSKGKVQERFGIATNEFRTNGEPVYRSDPRPVRNKKNLSRSFVGDSYVTDKYIYFYFFNFTEAFWDTQNPNFKEHFFYIYNKKDMNRFTGIVELPSEPLLVDRKGQIYLKEDDNPDNFTIGVYELDI